MAKEGEVKKLLRSKDNKILGGILGGIGEYLIVDPTAIRAVYVLLTVLTGIFPMILAYIILLFIIPSKK